MTTKIYTCFNLERQIILKKTKNQESTDMHLITLNLVMEKVNHQPNQNKPARKYYQSPQTSKQLTCHEVVNLHTFLVMRHYFQFNV